MPEFVLRLVDHRPEALWGKSLRAAMPLAAARPGTTRRV